MLKDKYNLYKLSIHITPNNIIVVLSNLQNNVISWTSSGKLNLHGYNRRINFHTAALLLEPIVAILLKKKSVIHTLSIIGKNIDIEKLLKFFLKKKIPLLNVLEKTHTPHNGCRLVKQRRK